MCDACPSYTAIGLPVCNICGATVSTPPVSRKQAKQGRKDATVTKSPKTRQNANNAQKPLSASEVDKRLRGAGLTTDAKLADGLANGVTAMALYADGNGNSEGVFLAYVALVERLQGAGLAVGKYRNRIVSGVGN